MLPPEVISNQSTHHLVPVFTSLSENKVPTASLTYVAAHLDSLFPDSIKRKTATAAVHASMVKRLDANLMLDIMALRRALIADLEWADENWDAVQTSFYIEQVQKEFGTTQDVKDFALLSQQIMFGVALLRLIQQTEAIIVSTENAEGAIQEKLHRSIGVMYEASSSPTDGDHLYEAVRDTVDELKTAHPELFTYDPSELQDLTSQCPEGVEVFFEQIANDPTSVTELRYNDALFLARDRNDNVDTESRRAVRSQTITSFVDAFERPKATLKTLSTHDALNLNQKTVADNLVDQLMVRKFQIGLHGQKYSYKESWKKHQEQHTQAAQKAEATFSKLDTGKARISDAPDYRQTRAIESIPSSPLPSPTKDDALTPENAETFIKSPVSGPAAY